MKRKGLGLGWRGVQFAVAAVAAAVLVACGGGSGGATGAGGAAPAVGVLSDAEIAGVRYTTSSGLSGVTDAAGRYNYNAGDTVTFTVGAVTLGQVPATGVVTPLQLAGGNATKLSNLLVMLQSLDADGDPSNGLNIPAAASSALTTAIDLAAAFSPTATTAITNAMQAGGISGGIKSASAAEAHFLSQAKKLMASNVWLATDANGKPETVLYFRDTGAYLIGNFVPSMNSPAMGFETGTINPSLVDAKGFKLSATPILDKNTDSGLSDSQPDERFAPDGDKITVADNIETVTRSAVENDPAGIVGAWRFAESSTPSPATNGLFVFLSNGYFVMVDAVGETLSTDVSDPCGFGGVELGRYTYNASTKVVAASQLELNTNGCVGLFESSTGSNPTVHTFTLSSDGSTAVWTGDDGGDPWSVNLVRVSK